MNCALGRSIGHRVLSTLLVLLSVIATSESLAAQLAEKSIPYYGESFYRETQSGMRDDELIEKLRTVLTKSHVRQPGSMDEVVDQCNGGSKGCYYHHSIGYKAARRAVLGELHLINSGKEYAIAEVYCQRPFTKDDFSAGPYPGPNNLPDNTVINVEHTWPQSRFNNGKDKDSQKSDLHHLFPTDSKMNAIRGNHLFGEVDKPAMQLHCPVSKFGYVNGASGDFFEPPTVHKGNVARALFYFSVRYDIKINKVEEDFLKRWHEQDPVDSEEEQRNERILAIQGNRNPFIDFPELVGKISDF